MDSMSLIALLAILQLKLQILRLELAFEKNQATQIAPMQTNTETTTSVHQAFCDSLTGDSLPPDCIYPGEYEQCSENPILRQEYKDCGKADPWNTPLQGP